MSSIKMAYYGDDFTGSTDALEFLCQAGMSTILFLEVPSADQLSAFPNLDAFGIAGIARSLDPMEMELELVPVFEKLEKLEIPFIHYKVCSTFDSAPHIGSIGKAIDIGRSIFNTQQIPVIGGMPSLGRYCMFGHLFARMGIGSNGTIYRLDKHESMRNHPVTPSLESDLTKVLSKQTHSSIGLIHIQTLKQPFENWNATVTNKEVVVVDASTENHIRLIGEWLMHQKQFNRYLFMVGGSSIEMALGNYWNQHLKNKVKINWEKPGQAKPLLVLSGSCSPVTHGQIEWALQNGFSEVILDVHILESNNVIPNYIVEKIIELLRSGKHTIVHTGKKESKNIPSSIIGTLLGNIAKQMVHQNVVKRILIAGGDTSSYAGKAMGIVALEMIAPLVIGAPLCKAHAKDEKMNGIELNFKGGQVGTINYFQWVVEGKKIE